MVVEMTNSRDRAYVVGADVGTGSVRAGVFDLDGRMVAKAEHPIQLFRPREDHVEQSSRDIWSALCSAVREGVGRAGVDADDVCGIGYDATCSLVALGADDEPVTVSLDGDPDHNVVVWMDHRAKAETDAINATGHRVLEYVGGRLSPEQQPPKLRWIKEHLPESWRRTAKFLDLADFLVYRSCGADTRSMCTVVCKWTYLGHEGPDGSWDPSFFEQAGLGDLLVSGRAGRAVRPLGTSAGGLTPHAAAELGLRAGTTVAIGAIDAHAGGIGSIGMRAGDTRPDLDAICRTLALVGGTSSCHLAVSTEPRFVSGVWGPYFGAMLPGMWLTEGGQTATGALLDHVIASNVYAPTLAARAADDGKTVYELLNERVAELRAAAGDGPAITDDLHVLPDFHGNRSPRADSRARGAICGLTLDGSFDALARLYCATIQAIAYGTRHIVEAMNANGYRVSRIHACGGGTKNPLWLQEHADVTGCDVLVAPEVESVLLGSAILAAVASGRYASIVDAIAAMSPRATAIAPDRETARFHDAKYEVFKLMYDDQVHYRRVMEGARGTERVSRARTE
jgi:FGGY-family pentulose kinase